MAQLEQLIGERQPGSPTPISVRITLEDGYVVCAESADDMRYAGGEMAGGDRAMVVLLGEILCELRNINDRIRERRL